MSQAEQLMAKLKAWEIFISVLLPIAVLVVGYFFNKTLKEVEASKLQNQKLIEKRFSVYDSFSAHLNVIYCACAYVGEWRKVTPPKVIDAKRACDKLFFSNCIYWSSDVLVYYRQFCDICIASYREKGLHAALRADIENYKLSYGEDWDESWSAFFLDFQEREKWLVLQKNKLGRVDDFSYSQNLVLSSYARLMEAFAKDLGADLSSSAVRSALRR